jgi:Na+/H+ antiporter NhaD/arsenite permease-like protein
MAEEAAIPVPLLACLPFAVLLLSIAVIPLVAPHWWHKNSSKGLVAGICGVAALVWVLPNLGVGALGHAGVEYASFIIVLIALFSISGGVSLEGDLRATPAVNTAFLATGTLIASIVGTTGASMLLIRPLLKTNSERRHVAHTVVFFIFLVSNVGGCLTPLGDPPLFLGYLRGVPFTWTLRFWREWALLSLALLALYWLLDTWKWRREAARDVARDRRMQEPLRLRGGVNLLLLAAVVAVVALIKEPEVPHAELWRNVALLALAFASLGATPRAIHVRNEFEWTPMIEVAVLFAGIFTAMVPALLLLEQRGDELGLEQPWHYFWATGTLSAFLDNAPTYLTFGSVAIAAVSSAYPDAPMVPGHIGGLVLLDPVAHAQAAALGARLLEAISLGAVFMGAATYIGNGPNFMVKAIAEGRGVKMPSFFGYILWATVVLVPLLVVMTLLFLV